MEVYKALLLDSSYYPIQILDWKKAIILSFTGRAEVVEHHEKVRIRSTSSQFKLPKVLRLFCSFKKFTRVKFNRANVFTRDRHMCQYCGGHFKREDLTFDHVMPRSRGGKTSWENIVTCCHECNNLKADKTPEECGFTLLKRPREPRWNVLMGLRLSKAEIALWNSWINVPDRPKTG